MAKKLAEKQKARNARQRKEKKNYLLQSFDTYVDSFKSIRWDILVMAVYDLLFFYIVFAIGTELFTRLIQGVTRLGMLNPPEGLDIATMTMHVQIIKGVYFNSIQDVVFAIILAIFFYSVLKSLIWARVMKKKPEWSYLSGFFITSILWFAAWTLLCVGTYFLFTPKAIMILYLIVTILLLHLTPILNMQLAKTSKKLLSMNSVKKTFKLGFARVHHFLLPYAFLIVTFIVIYFALRFILQAIKIMPEVSTVILVIYLMLYFSWHRIYLAKVIERIR